MHQVEAAVEVVQAGVDERRGARHGGFGWWTGFAGFLAVDGNNDSGVVFGFIGGLAWDGSAGGEVGFDGDGHDVFGEAVAVAVVEARDGGFLGFGFGESSLDFVGRGDASFVDVAHTEWVGKRGAGEQQGIVAGVAG